MIDKIKEKLLKEIEELKKGCGKEFKPYQSNLSIINYEKGICGEYQDSTFFFCDNCNDKLQKEFGKIEQHEETKKAEQEKVKIAFDKMDIKIREILYFAKLSSDLNDKIYEPVEELQKKLKEIKNE